MSGAEFSVTFHAGNELPSDATELFVRCNDEWLVVSRNESEFCGIPVGAWLTMENDPIDVARVNCWALTPRRKP